MRIIPFSALPLILLFMTSPLSADATDITNGMQPATLDQNIALAWKVVSDARQTGTQDGDNTTVKTASDSYDTTQQAENKTKNDQTDGTKDSSAPTVQPPAKLQNSDPDTPSSDPASNQTEPETAGSEKKAVKDAKPLDRRWIIKQPERKEKALPQKSTQSIVWSSKAQETTCSKYLKQVKESFLNARYYSIKGDACKTAEYSKAFNRVVDLCDKDCPQGFLNTSGYPDKTIRNLKRLEELGTKRCFQGDQQIEEKHTKAKSKT